MCIKNIIIFNMDSTPDTIFLKGKKNFIKPNVSTFGKFNVIQSLVCFMMLQINRILRFNILIKKSNVH